MTITLVWWQIGVLTLLIPILAVILNRLVTLIGLAVLRRWYGQSLNPIEANALSLPRTNSLENGSTTTTEEWRELFRTGRVQELPDSELVDAEALGFTPYKDQAGTAFQAVLYSPTGGMEPIGIDMQGSTGVQPSGTSFTEDIGPYRPNAGSLSWKHRFLKPRKKKGR